jgi:phosphoglycolate phosphatase-like HAD superfamily hydrolase
MSVSEVYESAYANQNPIDLDVIPTDWSGTIVDDRVRVWSANMEVLLYYKERGMYDGKIPSFDYWLQEIAYKSTSAIGNYRLLGLKVDLKEANSLYKKFYEHARENGMFEPIPYDGVKKTLEWLNDDRAKVLGVVSAHPKKSLDEEIKQFQLAGRFQFVEGDLMEWADKAHKLTELVESQDVDPRRIGYLCDMPNDIMACHMAEVVPIVHTKGWASEEVIDEIIGKFFVDEGREYRKFEEWTELTQIVF